MPGRLHDGISREHGLGSYEPGVIQDCHEMFRSSDFNRLNA